MPWLIMNDEVDYPSIWYPTHVVSKDKKLLPISIGAPQTVLGGYIGLWIKDGDYSKIRHDKAYIFIHDPEATDDDIESIKWDDVPNVKPEDQKSVGREHIHIWKEAEFNGTMEGGTA